MNVKRMLFAVSIAMPLLFAGCKDKAQPAENPISEMLKDTANITVSIRSSGPWELGIAFSVSKAGKITKVGSKMPEPGTYRILLWDYESKALLRQKTIEQSTPEALTLANLEEAVALIPDKKYVISINNQSAGINKKYYVAARRNSSDLMPVSKGSVLVHNAMYAGTATSTFPNSVVIKTELYGFPEFTFMAD